VFDLDVAVTADLPYHVEDRGNRKEGEIKQKIDEDEMEESDSSEEGDEEGEKQTKLGQGQTREAGEGD